MKKLLFTLAVLLMACNAFATPDPNNPNYLYVPEFEITDDLLNENNVVEIPVAAVVNYTAFALQGELMEIPEGMTFVGARKGADFTITYKNYRGRDAQSTQELFICQPENNGFFGVQVEAGYWQAPGSTAWTTYGAVKWVPGLYEEFVILVFKVDLDAFKPGHIVLNSTWDGKDPNDPRNGIDWELWSLTEEIWSLQEGGEITMAPRILTPAPEIIVTPGDAAYTIKAVGEGVVKLYCDGVEVDNPHTVERSDVDQIIKLTAIAHVDGQIDGSVYGEYLIPAYVVSMAQFHMDNMTAFRGEIITIPVQMTNDINVIAFQTDIYLPENFTLVNNEDGEPMILPSSRMTDDHVIIAEHLADDRVRIICFSPRSKVISGDEGDLFYISVAVPEDAGGDYSLYLRNSTITSSDYNEFSVSNASATIHVNNYTPGDVNDSHSVTVTDLVVTAQYILQFNPSPFIFDAADMNGDGNISVTDIMLIARLVMTPTANAPMRMPALESNDDHLSGEGITISTVETRRVSIALDNVMVYSAFQLDLNLPQGLTASNFALTDRAGSHVLDVQTLSNGKLRALCYSPVIEPITGSDGALLTFDVTALEPVAGCITVDGIEMVTTSCQTVLPQAFTIPVNNTTAVTEASVSRTVARVDYYNAAGQRLDGPATGLTIILTTYTDGTHTTSKIVQH